MTFIWYYPIKLYFIYLKRLKYFYSHYEKKEVDIISLIADKLLLNTKKYVLGSIIYLFVIFKHYSITDLTYPSLKKFDEAILPFLVKQDLLLFPSFTFYPSTAKITMTTDCNYRCNHCYQEGQRTKRLITLKEVEQFFCKIKDVGVKRVSLIGGEVFLYPDHLFKIIRLANSKGIYVYGITTNGFWCSNKQTVIKYLQKLKELNYKGNINISIGIGHENSQNINWFKGLRNISKKILGRNIFYFSVEVTSYSSFLKKKKKLITQLGHYYYTPVRIIQVGAGTFHKKDIVRENVIREPAGKCCGLGLHLIPNGSISFCTGPASLLSRYTLGKLNDKVEVKKLIQNSKIPKLLMRYKGKELYRFVDKKIKSKNLPFFCDLCMHISKNNSIVDILQEKSEKSI